MAASPATLDAFELLTRVDGFYNSAWNKLLAVVGVTGILAPVIIHFFQRSEFKSLIESHKLELKREMEETSLKANKEIEEARTHFSKQLADKINDIDYDLETVNAFAMFLQGHVYDKANNPIWALYSFLRATKYYATSERVKNPQDLENLVSTLHALGDCLERHKFNTAMLKEKALDDQAQKIIEALEKLESANDGFISVRRNVIKDLKSALARI